jgi:nitrite reductase/ring-hydroxylating ferredoxin subunit
MASAFIDIGHIPATDQAHIFCPYCGRQHRFKSGAPVVGPCSCGMTLVVHTASPMTLHTTPHSSRVKTAEAVLSRAQFVVDGIKREREATGVCYWQPKGDGDMAALNPDF